MAVVPTPGPKGPRRSLHFVPGGNARMFEKALTLNADTLILDLEDSVTPENKEAARRRFATGLNRQTLARKNVWFA